MLEIPEVTANLNWGGANWDELYFTGSTSLYRIRTKVRGNRVAYMNLVKEPGQ